MSQIKDESMFLDEAAKKYSCELPSQISASKITLINSKKFNLYKNNETFSDSEVRNTEADAALSKLHHCDLNLGENRSDTIVDLKNGNFHSKRLYLEVVSKGNRLIW